MPWLKDENTGDPYLGFKDVTLVPYEPKLIDLSLMDFYHVINFTNKYRNLYIYFKLFFSDVG